MNWKLTLFSKSTSTLLPDQIYRYDESYFLCSCNKQPFKFKTSYYQYGLIEIILKMNEFYSWMIQIGSCPFFHSIFCCCCCGCCCCCLCACACVCLCLHERMWVKVSTLSLSLSLSIERGYKVGLCRIGLLRFLRFNHISTFRGY